MGLTKFFQHGVVHADVRVVVVNSPRPAVELDGNRIDEFLAVDRQVNPIVQVLSNEPVAVLSTAPLQWAARVAEVHLHVRVGRQFSVPGYHLALLVSQRLAHRFANAAQLGCKAVQLRSCYSVSQLG